MNIAVRDGVAVQMSQRRAHTTAHTHDDYGGK
jgi:hypothetical protein